ncbi:hypothetical protein PHYBLDRAFT_63053 [Phycomyces blakesleeanus NRRL 1555(-)]|uniref:Uncharacterized protein n=1 Tax=Phycomyces blakesleeanus (strain ATCC 8743b / DSM 1359 / FGSC 10004 / NBRC 33097 / NRRL 1555) TaxID=763407 RepID=A0A167NWF3_PHYB8|nr:hypothetical protein PHYBLDRAFT_63053 [Phycomyces blakesleeanus NRRL 1555(-)]OAD76744.1 hypothetical protein PHYBLDRAFT_63053 [Phycomyces blakesleeanus NRRL 1555(-)]|eukprot:XP_018294784.1 hypothetical protein PHYBLDRAFT_63053 [Phycomyces blakesleeanus NRRL 1555(-)]
MPIQELPDNMIISRRYTLLRSKTNTLNNPVKNATLYILSQFLPVAYTYTSISVELFSILDQCMVISSLGSRDGKDGFETTFISCFLEDIYKDDLTEALHTFPIKDVFLHDLSKLASLSTPVITSQPTSSTIVQPPFIFEGIRKTVFTCQIQYSFIYSFIPPPTSPYFQTHLTHHDQHVFAFVNWFPLLADRLREKDGAEICGSALSPSNYHSILPEHRISLEVSIANQTTGLVQKKKSVVALPKKLST